MPTDKEDEVRQALGVEKEFVVEVTVPVTGYLTFREIVMAVTEEEACYKAKKVVLEEGSDSEGPVTDYDTAPWPEWSAEIDKELSD